MRLIIAEKPSLGRAIAAVLPRPHSKGEGFIRAANGDVVSWCIGHLLEQAEPDAYDPAFKQWRAEHLPIIPPQWRLQPKPQTRKQLTVLRKLVKDADSLVHAGDPDREGQLLVDEVIEFLNVPVVKRQAMQRLLISDLNPSAVSRALQQLRPNQEFIALSVSALARSRADWLYGINLTRAFTLRGRASGLNAVLSVGRVQTPVLGLVVRRDKEIEHFISKPFFEVQAAIHLTQETPLSFYATWQPSEACAAHQDDDGRILNPKLAANVAARIRQQPAQVEQVERKEKKQAPPLPFNLSALQIDAAKALGMSAQQVLDGAQSLYEKHQLITYPRSDCRYLPQEHFAQRQQVLTAVSAHSEALASACAQADSSIRSQAWNDARVGAHHAIIPTAKALPAGRLSSSEQKLYALIARQYLLQFFPHYEYADTKISLIIAGGRFTASERETLKPGWKVLLPQREHQVAVKAPLPLLKAGQILWSGEPLVQEKHTQPPAYFTDASLLAAMTGIGRFVQDKNLKSILKETDGLGTEATRAGIIELLFKRRFLQRDGKSIRSTELGRALITALPEQTSRPDMTAQWERQLNDIARREYRYDDFMQPLLQQLQQLVQQALNTQIQGISLPPANSGGKRRGSATGAQRRKTTATKSFKPRQKKSVQQ